MRRNFAKRIEDIKRRRPGVARALSEISAISKLKETLVGLRNSVKLTQRAFADITGWKQPHIARIETIEGAHSAQLASLVHYAESCNSSIGIVFVKEIDGDVCVHDIVPLTDDHKRIEFMERMKNVPCYDDWDQRSTAVL